LNARGSTGGRPAPLPQGIPHRRHGLGELVEFLAGERHVLGIAAAELGKRNALPTATAAYFVVAIPLACWP
jgi:hypothetical protein